jgi:hypothetical protein
MICEEKRKSSGFLLSIPLSQHQMSNLTYILVSVGNGSERSEAGTGGRRGREDTH